MNVCYLESRRLQATPANGHAFFAKGRVPFYEHEAAQGNIPGAICS